MCCRCSEAQKHTDVAFDENRSSSVTFLYEKWTGKVYSCSTEDSAGCHSLWRELSHELSLCVGCLLATGDTMSTYGADESLGPSDVVSGT